MIAYIVAWSEEVADGEYSHSVQAYDEEDCEIGKAREFDTAGEALRSARRLAAKHGVEFVDEDLCWENEDRDDDYEVPRWTDPYEED